MRTSILIKVILAGACSAALSTALAAGNAEAGKFKFNTCMGCHGIPGYSNAYPTYHVPRLAGQHAEYLIAALNEYQVGDRKHPTMHANAYTLSEQDIADIAAYLAALEPVEENHPVHGDREAGKAKAETVCASCHGADGNGLKDAPNSTFPRLAGQHQDYLVKALQDYKSGVRKNPIMNPMAMPLSAEDINNLAAWFASQEGISVVSRGK